jgi:hypothetical protein
MMPPPSINVPNRLARRKRLESRGAASFGVTTLSDMECGLAMQKEVEAEVARPKPQFKP